jgi:hypothetical protein
LSCNMHFVCQVKNDCLEALRREENYEKVLRAAATAARTGTNGFPSFQLYPLDD